MATRFKITQSKEDIIATGGIAMVGALLNDNRGLARVDKMTTDRIKKAWISNSGIIKSVVGLFTLARTDFAWRRVLQIRWMTDAWKETSLSQTKPQWKK